MSMYFDNAEITWHVVGSGENVVGGFDQGCTDITGVLV